MKLYRVKAGTESKLIVLTDGSNSVQDTIDNWTTRKDINFMDTITDPVAYHNNRDNDLNPLFVKLVQQGYALFCDPKSPRYILAVQYEDVRILA